MMVDSNEDATAKAVTPTKGQGSSTSSFHATPPSTADKQSTQGSDIVDNEMIASAFSSSDFKKLCSLLGLGEAQASSTVSLAHFLENLGCSTVEHLAYIQEDDFETYQPALSTLVCRMLLDISDFLKRGGCLEDVAAMKEITKAVHSTTNLAVKSSSSTSTTTAPSDSDITNESIIDLNVGGCKFTSSRDTLSRAQGSLLEAMVSGRHQNPARRNKDGSYFIDRNGTHFHHILDFLRLGGNVATPLPVAMSDREALAVEADYYGLDDLVRAIRMPKIDIDEHLGEETLKSRQEEDAMRKEFAAASLVTTCLADPFKGLIPLFCPDNGIRPLPLTYVPDAPEAKQTVYMRSLRAAADPDKPVTVSSPGSFRYNFNRNHPNILRRLEAVLAQESVIIAGGSVLQGLTSSRGIRTFDWWLGQSDVDLFVYGKDSDEASRIANRIFDSLAVDNERWVVMRSRGVITMHSWTGNGEWDNRVEQKVQIVLRLYDSPAEVLFGFDCDCCCCAYDGRDVWVTPRCVYALRHGINILNPLHAWPNKASYELRLAKYAIRGFAVAVPGIDTKRIDYDRIRCTDLGDLKGLARLLKVSFDMEAKRQVKGYPQNPRYVEALRSDVVGDMTACELVVNGLGGYYEHPNNVIIPTNYENCNGDAATGDMWYGFIGGASESFPRFDAATRREVWDQIANGSGLELIPDGVPSRLVDAWNRTKRSREYLNANMDKFDLDNVYYDHAYIRDKQSDA